MKAQTIFRHGGLTAIAAFFAIAMANDAHAQLDVTSNFSVEQYVNDVLLGEGVSAFNISYTGGMNQLGKMINGDDSGYAFSEGLVMSTSNSKGIGCSPAICSNCLGASVTDADLLDLANQVPELIGEDFSVEYLYDISILEFDFIVTGDSIGFDYIFGSDEYNSWINTEYNDVFGFFLSGPGIEGPYASPAGFPNGAINIAGVPGTEPLLPITVSSVNAVVNSEYYVPNLPYQGICINGYTTVFHAGYPVQCGETYHIKLAIADGTDPGIESVVILEQGSFTSNVPVNVTETWDLDGVDNELYEGCGSVNWTLTRPESIAVDAAYSVLLGFDQGSAENGLDYGQLMDDGSVQALPDTLTFESGVSEINLTIMPIADGLSEGMETLVVTMSSLISCEDGFVYLTYTISDAPDPIEIDGFQTLACSNVQILVAPEVTGGFGNYTYSWSCSNSTQPSIIVSTDQNWECTLTVADTCGLASASAVNTISLLDSVPLQVDLIPDTAIVIPGEAVPTSIEIFGGYPTMGLYLSTWYLNEELVQFGTNNAYTIEGIQFDDVFYVEVQDACGNEATDALVIESLCSVEAVITAIDSTIAGPDSTMYYSCKGDSHWFTSANSNAVCDSVTYYMWNWGDGSIQYTLSDTVSHQWVEPGVYAVTLAMADAYESYDVSEPFYVTILPSPQVQITADSPICLGGIGEAEVNVLPSNLTQTVYYEGAGTHLSDSIAQVYSFDIEVDGFSDTALLADCSDLKKIRATMEHAHVGALDMWVTCPDGSLLSLVENNQAEVDGCNGEADVDAAFLGVPIVEAGNDTAGVGYTYTWREQGMYLLDDAANPSFMGSTINPGSFTSCSDWCELEGCPVNGTWTLHIATEDSLGDGHFFGWNMQLGHPELDSLGLGNSGGLDMTASGFNWGTFSESAVITEDSLGLSASYLTTAIGSHLISFEAVDYNGCSSTAYRLLEVGDGLGFDISITSSPNACAETWPLHASLNNTDYTQCPGMPYSNSWCVGNNVDTVFTVCPMIQGDGSYMHLMFSAAELDSLGDMMIVYDGPDTSYPVLGTYDGDFSNVEWGSNDASGCLTFRVITNDSLSCGDGAFAPMDFTIDCNPFFLDVVWQWEPAEYVVDPNSQSTQAVQGAPVTQFTVMAYYEGEPSCFATDTVNVTTQLSAESLAFHPNCDVSNGTVVIDVDAPGVAVQEWDINLTLLDTTLTEPVNFYQVSYGYPQAFTFMPNGLYSIHVSNANCEFESEVLLDASLSGSTAVCGCTYDYFPNYNPNAVIDDGSCTFDCFDFATVDLGECEDVLGYGMVNGYCTSLQGCGWVVDGVDYSYYSFAAVDACKKSCTGSCLDIGQMDFGDCDEVLGYGLVSGFCMAIEGCGWVVDGIDYSFYSFGTVESCKKSCTGSCVDLAEVDFGACGDTLGVAIINNACSLVEGCGWVVDGVDYSAYTFETVEACDNSCYSSGGPCEPCEPCPEPDYEGWCELYYEDQCPHDVNNDGAVTIQDLLDVISVFGLPCPTILGPQ